MDRLRLDATHAWRSFLARPGATMTMLAVMGLGIGMTATMFALADPFLLRPLPYRDPGQLALVRAEFARGAIDTRPPIPTLEDWRGRTDLFATVGAYGEPVEYRVQAPLGATVIHAVSVSTNLFDVLGIPFHPAGSWTDARGETIHPIAVLDGPLLASLGTRSGDVVGRSFALEGTGNVQVVALLTPAFLFPTPRTTRRPQALTPAVFKETIVSTPGRTAYVTGVARLARGVSPQAAQAALGAITPPGIAVTVRPLAAAMTTQLRALAFGALAAGLLITIACAANVVNLMVARGIHRTREFATREAIGARRRDIVRLLFVEVAALAMTATAGSLFVASFALQLISKVIPGQYSYLGDAAITPRVIMFACVIAIGVVTTGFAAAYVSWRGAQAGSINQTLAAEARKIRWMRFAMVASQCGTAMVLLVGGVFVGRSYLNLWLQDTGFSRESAIVSVLYPRSTPGAVLAGEMAATVDRLRELPGVVSAGATTGPLLDDSAFVGGMRLRIGGRYLLFEPKQVTAAYFDAIGAKPLTGRVLRSDDRNWRGLVVNLAFAKRFWPGLPLESVPGQIVSVSDGRTQAVVVGVVPNVHDRALDRPPSPAMYRLLETPNAFLAHHFVLRLRDRAHRPDAAARQAVASVDPDAVVVDTAWLDERLAETVRERSFATLMLALFAIAGLGVTASGLAGVIAFAVARRTREIAIRRAVGAEGSHIIYLVVREAARAATAGAACGLVAGAWLSRFLTSYLFGVPPADLRTLGGVALLMIVVVLIAAWLPARRALVLSPTEALRVD
jgi:predicted permease